MTTSTLTAVDDALDALATDPSVSDDDLVAAFADIASRIHQSVRDLTAPMTHDQRRAMFAAFTDVFGASPKAARKVFTRLALGKPADAPVSWADGGDSNGQGALTQREASRVLDALSNLHATLGR